MGINSSSWLNTDLEDIWIYDKLILSRKMGYACGPAGVEVPKPDLYIVRPCVNILGMGRGAEIKFLGNNTRDLPAGYFWCEIFNGRHISVDYKNGKQQLTVEGFRNTKELWRFSRWEKVDDIIPLPPIFSSLTNKYEYINIEFIDNKPIEIHLRQNVDFKYNNTIAIPVWNDEDINVPNNLKYVESPSYYRKGFYID